MSEETPDAAEYRILHKVIRKITHDITTFSFNTAVSTFMICVNDLQNAKCNKRAILEPIVIMLAPFAPHIAEELFSRLGHATSVNDAKFPVAEEKYLIENTFNYPVSFNGKTRFMLELPIDIKAPEAEQAVLAHEAAQRWIEGKQVRKIIFVPKKIINVVVA